MTETSTYFKAANPSDWSAMVEKVLKGASADSLAHRDEDGLVTHAFYPATDDDATAAALLPTSPASRLTGGWEICQPLAHGSSNDDILGALASGATALSLADTDPQTIAARLQSVVLSAITIGFESGFGPGDDQAGQHESRYGDLYAALLRCADTGGDAPGDMRIDLGIDAFAGRGNPAGIAVGLGLVREAAPTHRLMRVDGWARHNQGLTAAQELGFVLAGMAEILREGVAGGAAITRIASHISARVALGGDMFDAIAKCRAMRRLHAGMLAACGVSRGDMPALYLQGFGGLRMMSVLDAEVNMLRTTTALLGGAIGGADVLAGFGHDLLTGETAASMRLVRMTQAMMIAESQLATPLDPAGGAPFIEQRSDDLAAAGWAVFQDIERGGGLLAALADGVIDDLATRAADSREADIRSGQTDRVGVTLQPRGETVPPVQPAFGHLRRPAAPVEALRRTVSQQSPRILLLRGPADNAGAQEKLARRWLDVAGMQAVALAHDDSDAIAAARPDGVIICGCDDAGAMGVVMSNDALRDVCRVTAEALAASDDKLGLLASLLPEGGSA